MEIDINEIRQVLSNIKDPKTGQDIVKAGLVKDLFLEGTELNLMIFPIIWTLLIKAIFIRLLFLAYKLSILS